VNPGAVEIWYDGVDQNCDGASDYDQDGDGHDSDVHGGDDCDDSDDTVHPGATEIFDDGIDQDCDGSDATRENLALGKPTAFLLNNQPFLEFFPNEEPSVWIPLLYNSPSLTVDGDEQTTGNLCVGAVLYYPGAMGTRSGVLLVDLGAEYTIDQVVLVGTSDVGNAKALSRFSYLKVEIVDVDGDTVNGEEQAATPDWAVGSQPSVALDFTDLNSVGRYIQVYRYISYIPSQPSKTDPEVVGTDFSSTDSIDAAGKTYDQHLSLAEIMVYGELVLEPPNPEDEATGVPLETDLSWSEPNDYTPEFYDVWFGTEEPDDETPPGDWFEIISGTTDTFVTNADLEFYYGTLIPDTLYYWQVIAYEPNEPFDPIPHEGPIWSFTTMTEEPTITLQPVSQLVEETGVAVFETTAVSANGEPSYQWYKDDGDGIANPGSDAPIGFDDSILTIDPVTLSDEGLYYCVADVGLTTASDMAALEVKRLKGYYPFDGDLWDYTGNGYDGTIANGATYSVDAAQGDSLSLSGTDDPNNWVSVSPDVLPATGLEITVSFWIKNTSSQLQSVVYGGGSGGSVVNVQAPWNGNTFLLATGNPDDGTDFVYYNLSGTEDQWTYVACTTNPNECKLYLNGVLKATAPASKLITGAAELWFGKNVHGLLDELKIYN
jgi:hypothetical protein